MDRYPTEVLIPVGPPAGMQDPYGGQMDPYGGGGMDPYGGGGMVPYAGGGMDPYGGGIDPYGGGMDPYGGGMDPYGDGMGPYGPAMDPYSGMQQMPYDPQADYDEMMYATYPPDMMPFGEGEYGPPFEGPAMYGTDPIYQYGAPYIDALIDQGYNGPWPADYYMPHHRRPNHDHSDSSSYDESDDDDVHHCCHHRRVQVHCCSAPRRAYNNGCNSQHHHHHHNHASAPQATVTQADIADLLTKFQAALSVRYKRANVVELKNEKTILQGLVKDKRALKKQVAKAKRDLLLKEAHDFNADAPIPGKRSNAAKPGQQVISIDFGH